MRLVWVYSVWRSRSSPWNPMPVESCGNESIVTSYDVAVESLDHWARSRVASVNVGVLRSFARGFVNVTPSPGFLVATGTGVNALALATESAKIVTFGRFGGVRSLVHRYTAGVGSTLPAPSIARTLNACAPDPGTSTTSGEVHAANGAFPSAHWNVEPASVEVNENTTTSLATTFPGFASVVSGGVRSTVQTIGCAVGSTLPAGSTASINSDRVASARPEYTTGDEHACAAAPFSEHWNVAVGSGELSVNVAVVEFVSPGGRPVTSVVGGVRSTVQV